MVRHIILFLGILVVTGCGKDDSGLRQDGLNSFDVMDDYVGTPSFAVAGDDFFCFDVGESLENGSTEGRLLFMNLCSGYPR